MYIPIKKIQKWVYHSAKKPFKRKPLFAEASFIAMIGLHLWIKEWSTIWVVTKARGVKKYFAVFGKFIF